MEESVNRIMSQGSILESGKQRHYLLKYGLGLNMDKSAKYTIIAGCANPFGLFEPFKDFIELLGLFNVDYTFLKKEYCCGNLAYREIPKEDRPKLEEYSRQFIENNLKQAKKLGSEAIVTFCCVCAYLYNRFFGDEYEGMSILFFPELLLETMKGIPKLNKSIAYYEGCYRYQRDLAPGAKINLKSNHELLDRIEGLQISLVPSKLCCMEDLQKIFEEINNKDVDIVVTSCTGCYAVLGVTSKLMGGKPQVKFLTEILLEAYKDERDD
ncbi:MAG: heterodisulfide reductase-related iron-sulfur binding cluster [Candidatus Jordarchaeum sp.]|uniref:heterodisulfide reductase-related iron-sulfur binding cluster n=1 Tax=Candidatus Jordarchaeum sp. TaxID=2823881 RepID=UPI004049B10C